MKHPRKPRLLTSSCRSSLSGLIIRASELLHVLLTESAFYHVKGSVERKNVKKPSQCKSTSLRYCHVPTEIGKVMKNLNGVAVEAYQCHSTVRRIGLSEL